MYFNRVNTPIIIYFKLFTLNHVFKDYNLEVSLKFLYFRRIVYSRAFALMLLYLIVLYQPAALVMLQYLYKVISLTINVLPA